MDTGVGTAQHHVQVQVQVKQLLVEWKQLTVTLAVALAVALERMPGPEVPPPAQQVKSKCVSFHFEV